MKRFWIVVRAPKHGDTQISKNPNIIYWSKDKAIARAKEIAEKGGFRTLVLQVVDGYEPDVPPVKQVPIRAK